MELEHGVFAELLYIQFQIQMKQEKQPSGFLLGCGDIVVSAFVIEIVLFCGIVIVIALSFTKTV